MVLSENQIEPGLAPSTPPSPQQNAFGRGACLNLGLSLFKSLPFVSRRQTALYHPDVQEAENTLLQIDVKTLLFRHFIFVKYLLLGSVLICRGVSAELGDSTRFQKNMFSA